MKNPWTRKNPFMSLWLSAANTAIGKTRGHATAAVKREANKAASSAAKSGMQLATDFWTQALKPPAAPRKRRSKR